MTLPIRKAVRVLLINEKNELLLMCYENFEVSEKDGTQNQKFWCTIDGGIEGTESIKEAAFREIYEETGLWSEDIELGPIVWHSMIELQLKGILTTFDETFIVAKTRKAHVALCNPTDDEKERVSELKWFTLNEIKESKDPIFPLALPELLLDILSNKYPENPIEI